MRRTSVWLFLFLMTVVGSACGYLDHEIHLSDEEFEETFGSGGLGLSGYGSSGCGGYGYSSHRARHPRLYGTASMTMTMMMSEFHVVVAMSDADLLEHTDVEMLDESEPSPHDANLVEQVYYDQLAARNRAIAAAY